MRRSTYSVEYKLHSADEVKRICVVAGSKQEAYDVAVYDELGGAVYSAWVASVTYGNGNWHEFNTFEGKPL